MPRRPKIPASLAHGPFTVADARRAGLNGSNLEGAAWRRIGPGTYVRAGVADTAGLKIEAAARRLPAGAVFSGLTAAWLHGLDVDPCNPIEITVAAPTTVSTRAGMRVRRRALEQGEVVDLGGRPATSMLRTLTDVCRGQQLTEAVVMIDQALHRKRIGLRELRSCRPLGHLIDHVDARAESPMETRLRMLLVLAGLPRPEAQVPIRNRFYRVVGRPDLYYPEQKLGIEYDGSAFHASLVADNQRQNRLLDAGVRLLRFTATDLHNDPDSVVRLVRSALAA